MVYHFLANLVETSILGQIGDIAVHLTIDLNILHHILAVGLETAVEVVQVLDAAHLAGGGVEQLRRQRLRQRVIALLLVAAHQVVLLFLHHTVQFRNLVGRVLQVGIHRDHHVALCFGKAAVEGRALAVVTAELDALHVFRLFLQLCDDIPRAVGAAVADKDHLIRKLVLVHHPFYP